MKKILILGGGTGGTLVANLLVKKLSEREASVQLVSANPMHIYQPGWLYVPFGRQDPDALSRPLKDLLKHRVELTIGKVASLDTSLSTVRLEDGQSISYDYLVIATGSRITPEDLPGFSEGADHFYSDEAARKLEKKLEAFEGGNIVIGIGGLPHKCPVAPLEFTFLLEEYLTNKGVRDKTNITYTYPLPRCFTIVDVAEKAQKILDLRGITVETFFNTESIDPVKKTVLSLEGTEFPYDLLVMTPPHRGAQFLENSAIADDHGWVKTNRKTLQVTGTSNVWAMGDTTDLPISKAGSTAHFEAPVIVERIASAIQHRRADGKNAEYEGHVMCFLESGYGKASMLDFNYEHPPDLADPSTLVHYEKMLFNKAYWFLVPSGRV